MEPNLPPAKSVPGTLHFVPPNLSAFEPSKHLINNASTNTLLWIGGLCDTLLSVTYPLAIANALGPTWSLVTASLSSSGLQFGVSSVAQDAEDMVKIISYLKASRPNGKIIIMGHSTGCQDCFEYVIGRGSAERPKVDGIILQAPVSDRQALEMSLPEAYMAETNKTALEWCRTKRSDDTLPNKLTQHIFGKAAITARRWVSLASPPPDRSGAEDFFSSDHDDERLAKTFGKVPPGLPWLILHSGEDAAMPKDIDKAELIQRWTTFITDAGGSVDRHSGIVPEATHNLNGCPASVVDNLVARVLSFAAEVERMERS